jgi:crotonobetainyl-CoA:carnitine CoA-transferase CaiB-like acyl-CoA transferase
MAGLLEGVRVIELAQLFTGDYAGQLLADEGADVVKFGSPFRGDYLRDFLGQIKPHTRGHSPLHITLNRNKRSVAIDLRTDEGKQIFWKALAEADVFLDGNTTGAIDKLGLGYREQQKVNADIIYAQVTGLGAAGPYAWVPTSANL